MTKQVCQGDVMVEACDPKELAGTKETKAVLALGEATGHHHRLVGGNVFTKNGAMFLDVKKTAKLVHEEHHAIPLSKGKYAVIRQREYVSADMVKVVVD